MSEDDLTREYVPVIIDYEAMGESEFVLRDVPTVSRWLGEYYLLLDFDGNPVGFRWPTGRCPGPPPQPTTTTRREEA